MKRTTITLAALLAALVPAAVGLWGNASFSQAVPVRVPASAEVVTPSPTVDDHGGDTSRDQRTEPGDDRSATSTRTPTSPRTTEAGDDHGGDTPRDDRTEPGDDRDSTSGHSGSSSNSDSNSGSNSGSGSSSGSGSGSGSSGSRSDDRSGTDDHGGHGDDGGSDDHGGHGSDD